MVHGTSNNQQNHVYLKYAKNLMQGDKDKSHQNPVPESILINYQTLYVGFDLLYLGFTDLPIV